MHAGLDLGASLIKAAFARGPTLEDLELTTLPVRDRERALSMVRARAPGHVAVTGGRSDVTAGALAPLRTSVVSEFDAWARGAAWLAVRQGSPLDEPYLLVSLGTGTSMLLVSGGHVTRVGGTALGGGTIVGLGALVVGVDRFDELTALAARGNRRDVDLLLGDVYPAISVPEFTAAHFGKLGSRRRADLAHALVGLVAENVVLLAAAHAVARGAACVAYGGSTLTDNPTLVGLLTTMTGYFGLRAVILADGAHAGAVGCLLAAMDSGG